MIHVIHRVTSEIHMKVSGEGHLECGGTSGGSVIFFPRLAGEAKR